MAQFGTQDAVGKQIGVHASRVSRAMRGEFSFEVLNCLRLAKALRMPVPEVLQAAGKGAELSLLEEFYGKPRRVITNEEWALLDTLRELQAHRREAVIDFLECQVSKQLAAAKPGIPAKKPRKSAR